MQPDRLAVVLLSGGLDSTTTLAIAVAERATPIAMTFRYGQRHAIEIDAARMIAAKMGVREHHIVEIDPRPLAASALTGREGVPKDRSRSELAIPPTYVPARNTLFLAYALALAETRGCTDIYLGVSAVDYSGYPDCRPAFIAAFESLARMATKAGIEGHGVRIRAPLLHLSKAEIIRRGLELGVDYSLTRSCYDPDRAGRACGHCDSCRIRLEAFRQVGIADPAPYSDA